MPALLPSRIPAILLSGLVTLALACGGGGTSSGPGSPSTDPGAAGSTTLIPPALPGENVWVAYQDGDGPWQVVPERGGRYTFNVTDAHGRYGVAFAHEAPGSPSFAWASCRILHLTRAEAALIDLTNGSTIPYNDANGRITGVTAADNSRIAIGWTHVNLAQGAMDYSIYAPTAPNDIVATRMPSGGAADRLVVLRGIAPSLSGRLPAMDFGSQGWALEPTTLTLTGVLDDEIASVGVSWNTATTHTTLAQADGTSLAFNAVPAAGELPGDYHLAFGQALNNRTGILRCAGVSAKTVHGVSLALPPAMQAPVISAAATSPYLRPSITWQMPNGALIYDVYADDEASSVAWDLHISAGWLNGNAHPTYTFPDFSALGGGWHNTWGLRASDGLNWEAAARWNSAPRPGDFTTGVPAASVPDAKAFWFSAWSTGAWSIRPSLDPPDSRAVPRTSSSQHLRHGRAF